MTVAATRPIRTHRKKPKKARLRWGWLEWFIIIQFLSPGLLFLPGAQAARFAVRALPYLSSLALLAHFCWGARKRESPPARLWLVAVLLLLGVGLFHPGTKTGAGVAQWCFQLAVMAPLFWAGRAIDGEERLVRVVWLVFLTNATSATLGVLQVIAPAIFLPGEFSRLALELNKNVLNQAVGSFVTSGGQEVIRPPGLSDLPGGAAVAAAITVVLGIAFGLQPRRALSLKLLSLLLAMMGVVTLYFTLVRSLAIMSVISLVAMFVLVTRQGELGVSARMLAATTGFILAAISFASAFGGQFGSVSTVERFSVILKEGLFKSFESQRGIFVRHTMEDLLPKYPLGAGLGRWGMMQVYFGDKSGLHYPPIHAEIQITGWLLDGGVPMWILYGGAILTATWFTLRWAISRTRSRTAYAAAMIFCIELLILGTMWAGPVFNTQLGILFWTLVGALHGTELSLRRQRAARAAALAGAPPRDLAPGALQR